MFLFLVPVYTYLRIDICIHIQTYTYLCKYVSLSCSSIVCMLFLVPLYIFVNSCLSFYIYMCVSLSCPSIYICIYKCIHTNIYIYIYVYMYVSLSCPSICMYLFPFPSFLFLLKLYICLRVCVRFCVCRYVK